MSEVCVLRKVSYLLGETVETGDKDPRDHEDLRDLKVAGYQIILKG